MLLRSNDAGPGELAVRLFGPFAANGASGPAGLTSRKAQALLAYLCRRPGLSAPRESLVGLLWADSDEEQARASLRQTLSTLKKALETAGYGGLKADAASIGLEPHGLWIDTAEFAASLSADGIPEMQDAVSLCRGEFLEGFGPVTPEFDRWLDSERAFWRARYGDVLLRLCDARDRVGDLDGTISVAQQLLLADPLQESVHRRLIRAFMRQRRYDAALRQYDTLRAVLSEELGVAPEAATQELWAEVRRARSSRPAGVVPPTAVKPKPGAAAARPSVAVLPFRSLSAGSEAALFAEGIAEEIIVELAREAGLLVVSRASSFQAVHNEAELVAIAEQLGVGFLLTGSARILADKVRVTAQLVHAASGQAAWAERYDRDLRDTFAIQTEIARTVTATVIGRIAAVEADAADARPFESLEAAAFVAQGQRHFLSFTEAGFKSASECFGRAVALDPHYARAYGLDAMARLYLRWSFELRGDVEDILPIAERAVMLDRRDAKGHCALGLGNLVLRRFEKAAHHFETGLAANPNDDLLLVEYGRFLIYVDRTEEGLARVREGMRLNPYHPNYYWQLVARCLHTLGHHAEALEAFARMEEPPFWIQVYLELCHRALGHEAEAQEARATYLRQAPSFDLEQFKAIFPFRNPKTAAHFFAGLKTGR